MFLIRPTPEAWQTVRVAIRGWGPTLRLIALMTAATACAVCFIAVLPF